jgi:hypothetical protein
MSNHQKRYDAICTLFFASFQASVCLMMCPSRVELRDEFHSTSNVKKYFYNPKKVFFSFSFSSPLRNFFSVLMSGRQSSCGLTFLRCDFWNYILAPRSKKNFSRLNGKSIFLLLDVFFGNFLGNFYLCACLD